MGHKLVSMETVQNCFIFAGITIISPEAKIYLNTESITPKITVEDIGDAISGVNNEMS